MMNNTLESRKGLKNKKKGLDKEEWMDNDSSTFTEEQKKLFNEYLEKVKQFDEEQRKIREELNDNLKKAKMTVENVIKEFDRKLSEIFSLKSSLDKLITSYEILSIKLIKKIYEENNIKNKASHLENIIKNLEVKLSELPEEIKTEDYEFNIGNEKDKRKGDGRDPSMLPITTLSEKYIEDKHKCKDTDKLSSFQLEEN